MMTLAVGVRAGAFDAAPASVAEMPQAPAARQDEAVTATQMFLSLLSIFPKPWFRFTRDVHEDRCRSVEPPEAEQPSRCGENYPSSAGSTAAIPRLSASRVRSARRR